MTRSPRLPFSVLFVLFVVPPIWTTSPRAAFGQQATKQQIDDRPHVVLVVGTHHYSPQKTLPALAERLQQYGLRTTVVLPDGNPERNRRGLPGLEALDTADVAIFYMRFLQLPEDQLKHVLDYVQAGKPVIGLRTSTHAFAYDKDDPLARWNDGFGRDVLGTKYFIHLQGTTRVEHVEAQRGNVLLNGVPAKFHDPGTLYKVELPDDAVPLLSGTGHSQRTGTVTNDFGTHELKAEMTWPVAWTWKNRWGGRVFGTTLGHEKSFDLDPLSRLLVNAVHWALDRPVDLSMARRGVESRNERLKRPVGELNRHDPEDERRAFKVLDGFDVNLWAAEPLLVNPIHMTWDPQGRLWVCCSRTYPQVKPGEEPDDMIVVLQDTDGDGRADKSTEFASGLYVPTGLELGDGGVYVANAPDLLFLKDTDGDLKADVRRVVLTGFATEDNHHSISAWRWGPGGWLYFQEGTFMHSQVETPHGTVRLENGGVFQFRPRDLRLQVYADYRASNPWGHMFDRWGAGILIDNPNLYFIAPLTANSRAKLGYESSGKGTKQAGGEFVSGRHLPEEYRGQIWTNQYKANTVTRYQVSDDGAGVAIKELEPLIHSADVNFRPVDLKVGPDGAVYILDWYNPLIGHMQHSFRDERRDTTHGRVWRVTHRGSPLVKPPKLVGAPLPEVVAHLADPEDWTRHQVKRVLYDADPQQAAATLERFVANLSPADPGFDHQRLEALWCYQTIDVVNEPLLRAVLKADDGRARAAAVRVLRYWHDRVENPLQLLKAAVADAHPRVRLEAVLTLGYVPSEQSAVIALRALNQQTDRYLLHALRLTIDGLQPYWLPAHRAGRLTFDRPEHRSYALSNLLTNEAVDVMVELLNAGSVDRERLAGPAEAVAQTATAPQLEKLVLTLVEHTREYSTRGREASEPAAIALVLEALDHAARVRGIVPKSGGTLVPRCFDVPGVPAQVAAARLVGAWKVNSQANRLRGFVNSADVDSELRRAAAESLGELGGRGQRAFLEGLTAENEPAETRYLGVLGLAAMDLKTAAPKAAAALAAPPGDADPAPLVDAFTRRRGGADLLAAALAASKPHPEVAARVMEHFIRIGEQHEGLVKALGGDVKVGSLEDLLHKEDAKALAAEAREEGDPARGEQIFRRADLACLGCHAVGRAGSNIGPDLAAIGSSSPPDYIVDAMLRPSKVIKEFYETVIIQTDDGRVLTGILVSADAQKVIIRDPKRDGAEVAILRDTIEDMAKGPSLMPQGLANKLNNRREFLDLAAFIMELGRPGPYARSTAEVLRRWRVGQLEDANAANDSAAIAAALNGAKRAYSMVNGVLPAADFASNQPLAVVAAEVDVTSGGRVQLRLNSTLGLTALLDGKPLPLADESTLQLTPGRRKLVFVVDTQQRGSEGLRVQLADSPGSTAAYQAVGGP